MRNSSFFIVLSDFRTCKKTSGTRKRKATFNVRVRTPKGRVLTLTATSRMLFHRPCQTSPNWPEPKITWKVISSFGISHLSWTNYECFWLEVFSPLFNIWTKSKYFLDIQIHCRKNRYFSVENAHLNLMLEASEQFWFFHMLQMFFVVAILDNLHIIHYL